MKPRYALPIATLLLGSACAAGNHIPAPIPGAIYIRVTQKVGCPQGARCVGAWPERTTDGMVVWVDWDTLVLYESRTFPRATVHVNSITRLEVCRGHEACMATTVNNAPSRLFAGVLAGATAAALFEGLGSGLTLSEPDFEDAATEGALRGAAIAGASGGGTAPDALWEEVTLGQLRQEFQRSCGNKPVVPVPVRRSASR